MAVWLVVCVTGFVSSRRGDEKIAGEDKQDVGVESTEEVPNTTFVEGGHECADLGLSVIWATCNVGAEGPEAYGDYCTSGEFKTEVHKTAIREYFNEISYIPSHRKIVIDDVATKKWGGKWRMPTEAEFEELRNNCDWVWSDIKRGYEVKSRKNDNSIFLPAAEGYWTSTIGNREVCSAIYLGFSSAGEHKGGALWEEEEGDTLSLMIRPVMALQPAESRKEAGASHEYVDLGLSVKWATCNVGADSPKAHGEYYGWGETMPQRLCSRYYYGTNMASRSVMFDDVATKEWGDRWRMPSRAEFRELLDGCEWVWTEDDGTYGYKVKSKKNGNSIFLPAAGGMDVEGVSEEGGSGRYWSSTYNTTMLAFGLCFDSGGGRSTEALYICDGFLVRPVWGSEPGTGYYSATMPRSVGSRENAGTINGHEYVDLGLSVNWATCNVGAESPEGYGGYYAYGETKTKSHYDEDNCEIKESEETGSDFSLGDSIVGTSRDVARVEWGGAWRMPTCEEYEELMENCDWELVKMNGTWGYGVWSRKNGNSIFIPIAGYKMGTDTDSIAFCYRGGEVLSFTYLTGGTNGMNHHIGVPVRPVVNK